VPGIEPPRAASKGVAFFSPLPLPFTKGAIFSM
jgi:hypothetical protein